jgi:F-type H+-transporting ATPase subunit b
MKNSKFKIQDLKISLTFFISMTIIIFNASFAFASGMGSEMTLMDWVWKIVNFAILAVILVVFVGKPLKSFLQQRKELIEKSIKEAQEAKELALKALAEVEERLKLKDREIAEIIASAQSSGMREKERLVEEAEKLKLTILEQAKSNIDYEVKRAKDAIKAEAAEAALELAEEKIKGKMTADVQDKLLTESLKLLEGRN